MKRRLAITGAVAFAAFGLWADVTSNPMLLPSQQAYVNQARDDLDSLLYLEGTTSDEALLGMGYDMCQVIVVGGYDDFYQSLAADTITDPTTNLAGIFILEAANDHLCPDGQLPDDLKETL